MQSPGCTLLECTVILCGFPPTSISTGAEAQLCHQIYNSQLISATLTNGKIFTNGKQGLPLSILFSQLLYHQGCERLSFLAIISLLDLKCSSRNVNVSGLQDVTMIH